MVFFNMVFCPSEKSSSSSTHKGHSLQGRKSPVNNSNQRRNSTSSHSPKAVSPPYRQPEPLSPLFQKSSGNAESTRKLERAMSEPSDRRAASAQSNSSRYKTELCRPFEESGTCKYGDKCQFAHGVKELRTLTRHPKYKTELCRSFHSTGLCPYGPRCHFIHNSEHTKATMFSTLSTAPVAPRTPSRPKALSSSSIGSSGDGSPPSSLSGSPTLISSSDDLFQFPTSAFPFPPEFPSSPPGNVNLQNGYMEYTTHEFNPDYYDIPNIFQERMLTAVFGSSGSSDGLDDLCGSPPLEIFPQPNTPAPLDTNSTFVPFPVFSLFGKQDP